jgi:hypothetical protein
MASAFYLTSGASMAFSWLCMSLASRADFHARARRYRAATRPSWLPRGALLRLHAASAALWHGVA